MGMGEMVSVHQVKDAKLIWEFECKKRVLCTAADEEIEGLKLLLTDSSEDRDLINMASEELGAAIVDERELQKQLLKSLLPKDDADERDMLLMQTCFFLCNGRIENAKFLLKPKRSVYFIFMLGCISCLSIGMKNTRRGVGGSLR